MSFNFFKQVNRNLDPYILLVVPDCHMPDISDLNDRKLVTDLMVNQLIGAGVNTSRQLELLRINFARIVDKAIDEYIAARDTVLEDLAEPIRVANGAVKHITIYTQTVINHLENCIDALKRALNLMDKMKSVEEGPQFEKTERRLIESYSEEIKQIRDSIQHIDEHIQGNLIEQGEPAALTILDGTKTIQIGKHKLNVVDLANLIRHLHELALKTNQFRGRTS